MNLQDLLSLNCLRFRNLKRLNSLSMKKKRKILFYQQKRTASLVSRMITSMEV